MGTKPKQVETKEPNLTDDGREAVIASEPKQTFEERTEVSQPWAEVEGK